MRVVKEKWARLLSLFARNERKQKEEEPPVPQTKFDQIKDKLEAISKVGPRNYSARLGTEVEISCIYRDIGEATDKLYEINKYLLRREAVPIALAYGDARMRSVDSLFVSPDRRYIDISFIFDFVKESGKLCDFVAPMKGAQHGVAEHNYRILTSTVNSIHAIASGLLQCMSVSK